MVAAMAAPLALGFTTIVCCRGTPPRSKLGASAASRPAAGSPHAQTSAPASTAMPKTFRFMSHLLYFEIAHWTLDIGHSAVKRPVAPVPAIGAAANRRL